MLPAIYGVVVRGEQQLPCLCARGDAALVECLVCRRSWRLIEAVGNTDVQAAPLNPALTGASCAVRCHHPFDA